MFTEGIFDAALSLPESLRSELADRLVLSLTPPGSPDDATWSDEIRARLAAHERGELDTVDLEAGMSELERRQQERRRT